MRKRRATGITVAAAATVAMLAGCGGERKLAEQSEASRTRAVCEAATHSLLRIDETLAIEVKLETQAPKPRIAKWSAVEGFFRQAAEQGQKVDAAIAVKVRRLPVSADTPVVLADLARNQAQLRVVARMARGRSLTSNRRQHNLTLAFVRRTADVVKRY